MTIGDLDIVIPDVVEPILAHRAWLWGDDDGELRSTTPWGVTWPDGGPLRAECRHYLNKTGGPEKGLAGCGQTPSQTSFGHAGHGCGIYAYSTIELLAGYAYIDNHIFGQVLLSGAVYEHEKGYRAERATVSAIYDTGRAIEKVVAERHDVPLITVDGEALRKLCRDAQTQWNGKLAQTNTALDVIDMAAGLVAVGCALTLYVIHRLTRRKKRG